MPDLKLKDASIYYELAGAEGKPVVLFLHGLGSSVRDWELQIPVFSQDYRVLAIDMRGHGRSSKPSEQYTMAIFAQDVIAVMDSLKIEKAHVVGLSMGGMIAFQMAVDCPERIQSLSIVNSGPAVVPRSLQDRFAIFLRFAVVRIFGMRKFAEIGAPKLFVDAEQEALRQTFIERWAANDPKAYLNALRAIVGWTVEERIGEITIPSLIAVSDQDYTPVSMKEAYMAKMKNKPKLVIIPNAHHAVSSERPEAFNQVILEFLRDV